MMDDGSGWAGFWLSNGELMSGGVVISSTDSFLCFRDSAGAACRAVVNSEGRWPVVSIHSLGMWQILQRRLC
jgi:hypothetical protein